VFNYGSIIRPSGASAITFTGALTNSGLLNIVSGTIGIGSNSTNATGGEIDVADAAALTLNSGPFVSNGNILIATGGIFNGQFQLTFNGATLSNDGQIAVGGITFNDTTTLSGQGSVQSSLTLVSPAVVTLGSNHTIRTLSVGANSKFDVATYQLYLNGGGAALVNNGTFAASAGYVGFTGTSPQTISGTGLLFKNGIINNATGDTLKSPLTVTGTLSLGNGNLVAGANLLTLSGANGALSGESASGYFIGTATTTQAATTGTTVLGGLGVTVLSGTDNLGNVTLTRVSGPGAVGSYKGKSTINRKWTLSSDNAPVAGRNVTFTWPSPDDNARALTAAQLWKSTDAGTSWFPTGTPQNVSSTRSFSTTVTSFGSFTIADSGLTFPVAAIAKKTITYAPSKLGVAVDSIVSISNTGNDTLKVSAVASSKSYFTARPSKLVILPGQSANDTLRFVADSIGSCNANVVFTSNTARGFDTVAVSGYGVGTPTLAFNASSFKINYVALTKFKDTTVTITNNGTDTLKISGIASTKNFLTFRPATLTVPPGQSRVDTIRFTADSAGIRKGFIIFTSNDAAGKDTLTVTGNEVTLGVASALTGVPSTFAIYQNYPNPFNPTTAIRFDIPQTMMVSLVVYDILGKEVETLVSEVKQPGKYEVVFNAKNLASGVYLYRINAGQQVQTRRFVLLK
jgi:hypothetical protein